MKRQGLAVNLPETEKDFSTWVEDALKLYGWRWCHFRTARTKDSWRTAITGHKGFPDYIAVRGSRLLIFELKSESGKLSEDQRDWLEALRESAVQIIDTPLQIQGGQAVVSMRGVKVRTYPEVYVWKPHDREEITQLLRSF